MSGNSAINRYNSIIYRLGNSFFDRKLQRFHLGSGQQFFLMHLSKHPGSSLQELALGGQYDKATATRAVKKLEEEGYVRLERDEEDKRVRHIYVTDKAKPVVEATWIVMEEWIEIMTEDFAQEEVEQAQNFLEKMAENAYKQVQRYRQEE